MVSHPVGLGSRVASAKSKAKEEVVGALRQCCNCLAWQVLKLLLLARVELSELDMLYKIPSRFAGSTDEAPVVSERCLPAPSSQAILLVCLWPCSCCRCRRRSAP